jgi:serine phosphatase RsbU (regulator of sigma subunit)/anti-anti-sigma regulatory factor
MSTNKRRPTRADSIDCDYDYDSVISMQNTGVGVGEILQYSSALLTPDEIRALVRGYERLLYDLETDSLFAAYELAPSETPDGSVGRSFRPVQMLNGRRASIFVVDDDEVTRRLTFKGLEPFDCENIFEAKDGLEARQILLKSIDLVITDLLMPNLDGVGLMRWGMEHCPNPVWIVLSGVDTFESAVDAIHVGAFDFLAKPLRMERLRVAVRNALDHRNLLIRKEQLQREADKSNTCLGRKVHQLERVCRILEDESQVIKQDFERAAVIQSALLPAELPRLSGVHMHVAYRPGNCVGGDLYHATRINKRYAAICIADAAGHGVSAAMMSVLFKHHLRETNESGDALRPREVLGRINNGMIAGSHPCMFVSAIYGVLDLEENSLVLASAGHPPALFRSAGGRASLLNNSAPALGLRENSSYDEQTIDLKRGDQLLFFTDGVFEAEGRDVQDCRRLARRFERFDCMNGGGPEFLRDLLIQSSSGQEGSERDDVTMILLQVEEGTSTIRSYGSGDAAGAARRLASPGNFWMSHGESDETCCFRIAGRGTWVHSDSFFEAIRPLLEAKRSLLIDLSACEHLDSTFLGTIHQVAVGAKDDHDIRIQGLQPAVRPCSKRCTWTASSRPSRSTCGLSLQRCVR